MFTEKLLQWTKKSEYSKAVTTDKVLKSGIIRSWIHNFSFALIVGGKRDLLLTVLRWMIDVRDPTTR